MPSPDTNEPRPAAPTDVTLALPGTDSASADRTMPAVPGGGLPPDLADHPRYRIVRLVGQGGMGSVYEAEHRVMGRRVALKVIHPRFTADAGAVERFRREVRSAAKLHHRNIVAAYDAEQAGQTHFLVMEFVEGQSLGEVLRDNVPLTVAQACDCARQAAVGLQYAHELGMVHRDIKPDNLMLTPEGVVKILDFGLARLAATADVPTTDAGPVFGSLTAAGSVMGTPDYIAPEQATDAHSADIRADLYALGCTLYHLLTRHAPFPDGGVAEKLLAHARLAPKPLARWRPGLPDGLAEVVGRLMAKRPEDRYATPAEAAEALEPFSGAPPEERRSWSPWVVGVAVVVGLVWLALVWWALSAYATSSG